MSDNLIYEVSSTNENLSEPFVRKDTVFIIDQNNSQYSNNMIIIDSASVSNSQRWADFSKAYITLPLLITMTSTFNFSGVATEFVANLKNGYHQLVNSLNVEYNNSSVIQVSNLTNMYVSYKLNTSFDVNTVVCIGSQIGFYLDSELSWNYTNATTKAGTGSVNNATGLFSLNLGAAYTGQQGNQGFVRRLLNVTFNNSLVGVETLLGGTGAWVNVANLYQKNYVIKSNVQINGYYQQAWNVLATIRLKDIANFFEKLPLIKGAFIKMYLYLNQSRTTLTIKGNTTLADAGKLSITPQQISIFGGVTNPLLISSAATNIEGSYPLSTLVGAQAVDQQFTFSVSLLNSLDTNCYSPFNKYGGQTSCRLYVDLYTMNPIKEEEYLLNNRTKVIEYTDIFQYQFLNTAAGSTFNFLVSNGIANLQEVIVVPIISGTYNGTGVSTTSFSPIVSPFSSEPATCSPLMWINNFNIQISSVNQFINSEMYSYEMFQNELLGVNSVNGARTDGLMSGLISQLMFQNNYGYMVCNTSRRLAEEDRTPKSVQILGNNMTQVPMDLYVFCVLKKSITVDLYSGKRLA